MQYSFIGSLGKLSYTCAFWELFLNIDTNQWYLSKCDYLLVVLPLYGMGNVQQVHETIALNIYWVSLLYNCH